MQDFPVPRVEMRGIHKRFGTLVALEDVALKVCPGEVVGLVGDNGAGKSTLMKIVSGTLKPDAGEIFIDGKLVTFHNPKEARMLGIEMIYQDLALCDELDVASNFFLGREPSTLGFLKIQQMHNEAQGELRNLGIRLISTRQPIRSLSGGQRQAVAIGRASSFQPRLLIMDEPTASLGVHEVSIVLNLIKNIKKKGVGVVLISHRLQDIIDVCDRVSVLYEGHNGAELIVSEITLEDIVNNIVGGKAKAGNGQ